MNPARLAAIDVPVLTHTSWQDEQLGSRPTYAYDQMSKRMKCGQAVTRVVADQPYDPDRKLVDYR